MNTDALRSLELKLGRPVHGTEEVRFLCPFCSDRKGSKDSKHHMYVNLRKEKWICFRCGAKGSLKYLLEKLGISEDVDNRQLASMEEFSGLIAGLQSVNMVKTLVGKKVKLEYPCETKSITKGTDAYSYLRMVRKYTEQQISVFTEEYKMVTGYHVMDNRIFMPTFDEEGDMIYWIARSCLNRDPRLPKYVNPENTSEVRKSAVFNLYKAASRGLPIIICEGVFSAIACGNSAVALFGKTATPDQISNLCHVKVDDFIICLDGDATKEAYDLASSIYGYGKSVSVALLPYGEDPDTMDKVALFELLANASKYDHSTDIVRQLKS